MAMETITTDLWLTDKQRALMERRMEAVRLSDQYPAKAIASKLGYHKRSVERWLKAWREYGE